MTSTLAIGHGRFCLSFPESSNGSFRFEVLHLDGRLLQLSCLGGCHFLTQEESVKSDGQRLLSARRVAFSSRAAARLWLWSS